MDNKGLARGHIGFDSQPGARKTARKPIISNNLKKNQPNNVNLYDVRGQGIVGQHPDPAFPLFNNRSLSVLSTMHHLNPHRKVAMSPEVLRDAEEQATTLRKAVRALQEQLEKTTREKARIHRFLSDLLYTLNARGYESVQDHEGTLVDLNKCKGETYLDLKGRDLKRVNVRRPGGQELLLKAVIGNQERSLQHLVYRLESIGRDLVLDNRLTNSDGNNNNSPAHDGAKVAALEAQVLQLVGLIEGTCRRCPEVYPALRDYHYLNEGGPSTELSPRNPVIQNLLNKCEQIASEAQSKQLIELLSRSMVSNRPKSEQSVAQPNRNLKLKPASKSKSATRNSRPVSPEVLNTITNNSSCGWTLPGYHHHRPMPCESGIQPGIHLKPLTVGSKSENFFCCKQGPPPALARFPRPTPAPAGCDNPGSGGEPITAYLNKMSVVDALELDCGVSVCPYCKKRFGIEESISDIKNHIEMHVFAGDAVVA